MVGRYANFFSYPTCLSGLIKHTNDFYEKFEGVGNLHEKFKSSVLTAEKIVHGFLVLNFFSFLLPVMSTFIFYLFTNEKVMISPIYLPYTDLESDFGYNLNNLLCIMLSILGYLGFSTHDGTFILYGYQSVTFVDVLCVKLDELAVTLNNEERTAGSSKVIKEKLKEIVEINSEYQKLIDMLVIFSSIPAFFGFVVNVLGICLCIVGAVKVSFVAGCAAAIGLFIQIAIPCLIGNLINLQSDRFERALYDLPWYKMEDLDTKRIYLQFLLFSQKSGSLWVPFMGVMDIELLKGTMNAIYSYTMFIFNFVV